MRDWNACAREVGRALSRYDGNSTWIPLQVIFELPLDESFGEKASFSYPMLEPTIKKLIAEYGAGSREEGDVREWARYTLSHCTVLGFLHRAVPGDLKTTARFGLTPFGRAYRAAQASGNGEFKKFLQVASLLDNDFDMYGLLLTLALHSGKGGDREGFEKKFEEIRSQKRAWLEASTSSFVVREKVQGHVQRDLGKKSMKEHFGLRRYWARQFGHMDEEGLTEEGRGLAERIRQRVGKNAMFWLAPAEECVRRVSLVSTEVNPMCSGWDLLRPEGEEAEPDSKMVDDVADFMTSAFPALRLRSFTQAPLGAILPYVYFLEAKRGHRVHARALFQEVMKAYRETLHCMLLGVLERSQYRLRGAQRAGT